MKRNENNIAKAIAFVAKKMANHASGTASILTTYQPKEPKKPTE